MAQKVKGSKRGRGWHAVHEAVHDWQPYLLEQPQEQVIRLVEGGRPSEPQAVSLFSAFLGLRVSPRLFLTVYTSPCVLLSYQRALVSVERAHKGLRSFGRTRKRQKDKLKDFAAFWPNIFYLHRPYRIDK